MFRKSFYSVLAIILVLFLICQGAYAQLEYKDIGDAEGKAGTTEVLADGSITIVGAGHDIWDSADGFRYAFLEISGDFEAITQITFFERVQEWAKAGIMARQSADADSKNALSTAAAAANLGVQLTWRAEKAGETKELDYWEMGGPVGFIDGEWIRLTRSGNDFSASWSKDGKSWADDYASIAVNMDDPILLGLAVTSCEKTMFCKATFKNMSINGIPLAKFATAVDPNEKLSKSWGAIKLSY